MNEKKKMKVDTKRNIIQVAALVLFNGFIKGFTTHPISFYTGKTKAVCVPVLNCYSCPGALGACPIGSLQHVLSGRRNRFSFYVLGSLMLFGIVLGRAICGFLCPFGLIQGLLHKIPVPKLKIPAKADSLMRYLKYVILVIFVIALPLFLKDKYGVGAPYFCKLICPAGTLEAGIPQVLGNPSLKAAVGSAFYRKMAILILCLAACLFIYRPFCKYICPLGAIYSLFNKFSFFRMALDKDKCIGCKACERACLMNVEVTKNINSPECIRCGKCIDACPKDAIHMCFGIKENEAAKNDEPVKNIEPVKTN